MFLLIVLLPPIFLFFFFNDTATTEIYTLSLHDALPISFTGIDLGQDCLALLFSEMGEEGHERVFRGTPIHTLHKIFLDRKSTRLNSSHTVISYAVFCLKKKTTAYHFVQIAPKETYLHTT